MKIKKGDTVKILQGRDRGKEASVVSSVPAKEKLIVEGINQIKRHVKPRRQGEKGQIIETSMPLAVSNVMLVCPKCSQPTKVGITVDASGKKERICKKCKAVIS